MRHRFCREGVALAGTRQLHSHGPMSVQAHCTEGKTRSKGWEGTNGVEIGVGSGNGDGNGVGGGNGDGDRNGAGTGTGVEVREGTQDRNGDESGD